MTLARSIQMLCFCAAALLTCCILAQGRPAATRQSNAEFSDEGVFNLYVNEDRIEVVHVKLSGDGTLDSNSVLTIGGQSIAVSTHITPDEQGQWKELTTKTPAGAVSIRREGNRAQINARGKTESVDLEPGTFLLDNASPVLMSYFVRAYDRAKGGRQSFPVLIEPGARASLEHKGTTEKVIGGRDVTFDRFLLELKGIDLTLWTDPSGKVYLVDVPAQHAAYVREGYEILRKGNADDPLLSKPQFGVRVESNHRVAMRDGVHLATDVYRPDADGKFPVILSRTPYDRRLLESQGRFYARRGYVFAAQDCRGRFGSEGPWEPFVNEKTDGFDSIEWLAAQPLSSGKVGMIGGSYLGWAQWLAASQHPPHLVTIIPNVSPPEAFYNIPYEHGVFFLYAAIWWADVVESTAGTDLAGELAAFGRIGDKKYNELLRSLPVIDLDKKVLGKENRYWRAWIAHWSDDDYWRGADFYDEMKEVNLPVFHQSGWFDGDGIGTKLNYQKMTALGHGNQKLIMGPWGHTDTATRTVGEWDFGPRAVIDLQREYLRWFDHWLKGVDNGIEKEPLVRIFVMGSTRWLCGDAYPIPGTRFQKWYLSGTGHANTSAGDGQLGTSPPPADAPPDHYAYDPGDPTPNPDLNAPDEEKETSAAATRPAATQPAMSAAQHARRSEAHHARVTAARRDILVFTSAPLAKPLTIAGPVSAVIYAASSARDTDWHVRLVEVTADGRIWARGAGRVRARFRDSNRNPRLLVPSEICEYHLDLWQTGVEIAAGSRLRVEVCSADFPVFSRNLNTGGHSETETRFVTAHQTIYHDASHPSHVLLPVIPPEVLASQQK